MLRVVVAAAALSVLTPVPALDSELGSGAAGIGRFFRRGEKSEEQKQKIQRENAKRFFGVETSDRSGEAKERVQRRGEAKVAKSVEKSETRQERRGLAHRKIPTAPVAANLTEPTKKPRLLMESMLYSGVGWAKTEGDCVNTMDDQPMSYIHGASGIEALLTECRGSVSRTSQCLRHNRRFSVTCANCIANFGGCKKTTCKKKCGMFRSSATCEHCIYEECWGQFFQCSGYELAPGFSSSFLGFR